jgi:ABC-2 type transport system ATP-binding protein
LAKTPRTWTGARTPSGLKRVRQANRRHEVLGPRRAAAKTYVTKALSTVGTSTDVETATAALTEALSALDRAVKAGAIHRNAAARRKSRLTLKVNAAVGGVAVGGSGRVTKQTGKAAAQKAAKARIAASKSTKAKGAQTAAGKARAALSKTARAEAAAAKAAEAGTAEAAAPAKPPRPAAKSAAAKTTAAKTTAAKTTRSTGSKSTAKAPAKRTTKS